MDTNSPNNDCHGHQGRSTKTWKTTAIIVYTLALFGCATVNWNDPLSIAGKIKVKRDDFKKLTTFEGPSCAQSSLDTVFLRAVKNDNGSLTYLIYVSDFIDGVGGNNQWRYYDSAHDSIGNRLDTTQIHREVLSCSSGSCMLFEHVGLHVSKAYLQQNQDSGITFKISGKAGEEIFSIPAAYVKAFLSVAK